MLACGSRVRARFGATQYGRERCPKTYRGVIVAAFDDGFFKVEYDDGEVEDRVDPRWIKIDSAPHPPPGNRALREVRGGTSCEGRARGRSDAATSAGRTSKPSTKRPRANLAQQPAASPPAPVLQQQLRNDMAITIEQHGFVEAPTLFPAATCTKLRNLDRASAVEISNALQLTVTGPELRLVLDAAERSDVIRQAVLAVYGVEEYTVPKDSVKVLDVAPGNPPQIPHADDTCNREFFVIVQLNSGQAPTECVPYRSDVEYPFDPPLRAECSKCGRWCMLTDYAARRREHCAKDFNCEACGEVCGAPSCDDTQVEELFCDRLQSAFSELIDDPAALISKMRPCGPLDNRVGDGIVAMPTLVHRGPGTMSLAPGAAHRAVCFFTIRPKFRGERSALSGVGTYDANRQIHGAWLLWRLNDRLDKRARQSAVAAYAKEGYRLSDYGEELS